MQSHFPFFSMIRFTALLGAARQYASLDHPPSFPNRTSSFLTAQESFNLLRRRQLSLQRLWQLLYYVVFRYADRFVRIPQSVFHDDAVFGHSLFILAKSLFEAELAPNQVAERVLDFIVSGNWSLLSVRGIHINIVAGAMSLKIAASLDQFVQELVPFQTATSICFV